MSASLRLPLVLRRRPRPVSEREPSDMHVELLERIIGGIGQITALAEQDREVLFHFLFGVEAEVCAARLALPLATVERHLARIHLGTGTQTRRELLEAGLAAAKRSEARDAAAQRRVAA